MKKTKIIMIALLFLIFSSQLIQASSNIPYQSYTYDYWEDIVNIPAPYTPGETITGQELESGNFNSPQDLTVTKNGDIYIADTGNNRIVILNKEFELMNVIETFENEEGKMETFNGPSGVFISEKGAIYIADTNNSRVVILDEKHRFLKYIQDPESEILEDNFVFTPLKVAVDYADRVYVISKNMYQGILTFDEKGDFTGFSGTINVSLSFAEKVWRVLSTKEQRSRQILYIPTEFTGLDIDPDGFIYASNIDSKGEQGVRRLNPKGEDVIKKSIRNNLGGDQSYRLTGDYSGPSKFIDIAYRGAGIYSALDSVRGRIFTYDDEGNLLYVFGGMGTQEGTFRRPVAMETLEDQLLVLDAGNNAIIRFSSTQYGNLINQAVGKRFEGDESQTVAMWEDVLKLDTNNELAYIGIGKSYLTSGENKKAVSYLKRGKSREYYSIAYKRYRNERLQENFSEILTTFTVGLVIFFLYRWVARRKNFRLWSWLKSKRTQMMRGGNLNV